MGPTRCQLTQAQHCAVYLALSEARGLLGVSRELEARRDPKGRCAEALRHLLRTGG